VSVFAAVDIYRMRNGYKEMRSNPLRKMSARMLANAVDERIDENEG